MIRNEQTSERVASIAGKLLSMKEKPIGMSEKHYQDMRTLAASVLTQAPNKINQSLDSAYDALVGKKRPIYRPYADIYKRYLSGLPTV